MAKRKAAAGKKTLNSESQNDRKRQGATIRGPATLAEFMANWPTDKEIKAKPSKRRHGANDPNSATDSEEDRQLELDILERIRKANEADRGLPIPDPRAKPTREPPEDHYYPCEWVGVDPKELSEDATSLDHNMYQWTYNYADKDNDGIEARMTAKEKQAIIDYLGDWCLFDDWDSLVASFSPLTHLNRFHLLLTATVLKNVFERVVRNPFFYIDLEEEWDGSGSDLPPPHGAELNKTFQKALKVSETSAHHWRASTVKLFNRFREYDELNTPLMAKDPTPGIRSYNLRERCIDQFTSDMLDSSSLITPMLSPRKLSLDQIKLRYQGIRECYKTASDMAVRFYIQRAGIKFDESVKEVAAYKIPRDDEHALNRWVASVFNCSGTNTDDLFEGKRAVMVLWPATWIIQWKVSPDVRERWQEMDAKYPPNYDLAYRDARGVHHSVISSGIVLVEKDGREPPLTE